MRAGDGMKINARRKFYRVLGSLVACIFVGVTVLLLLPLRGVAGEETMFVTYSSALVSTQSTEETSSPREDPQFSRQTQEDAAAFVASDGVIRGPYLESAILEVRRTVSPNLSDQAIASFILSGA